MTDLDVAALRKAVRENRYLIRIHAKRRMGERKVSDEDVQHVVVNGDVIEQNPRARPFPKALFLAFVRGEPLYVSCAFDGSDAHIITVHWYDPDKWIDPWSRRED